MSNFTIYLIGFAVLVGGLAVGAHLMGLPLTWIAVGALILIGLGVIKGVTSTRRRESSGADDG